MSVANLDRVPKRARSTGGDLPSGCALRLSAILAVLTIRKTQPSTNVDPWRQIVKILQIHLYLAHYSRRHCLFIGDVCSLTTFDLGHMAY
jgi:hypothetical protein